IAASSGVTKESVSFDISPVTNLVAGSVSLNGSVVSYSYTIEGSQTVPEFDIDFTLHHQDASIGDQFLKRLHLSAVGDRSSGVHAKMLDLAAELDSKLRNNDTIIVTLDSTNSVTTETSENDNSSQSGLLVVDIAAVDIKFTL